MMQSTLYQEPYDKGVEKGIKKGEIEALTRTAIKFLVKKFGFVPEDLKQGITELDAPTLEVIFEIKSLDDIKKYIQ